ncbi:hypothetical protein ACFOOM_00520 [Streptomyces echinoruber]|nr:hypothetical protein [Streptomyces echinoruber]
MNLPVTTARTPRSSAPAQPSRRHTPLADIDPYAPRTVRATERATPVPASRSVTFNSNA